MWFPAKKVIYQLLVEPSSGSGGVGEQSNIRWNPSYFLLSIYTINFQHLSTHDNNIIRVSAIGLSYNEPWILIGPNVSVVDFQDLLHHIVAGKVISIGSMKVPVLV